MKKYILYIALILTLLAAWFAPANSDESLAMPSPSRSFRAPSGNLAAAGVNGISSDEQPAVLKIRSRNQVADEDKPSARLFEKVYWNDEETKTATTSNIQTPVANSNASEAIQIPPLPFQIIGKYKEAGRIGVFIQYMNNNYVVYAGDSTFKDYKIESIDEVSVVFRYLPLDQIQTLPIASGQ
ncbi:hypothetical protein [Acinetobacter sp.]|uniref:hypothetical protein n=1 Tax=Acinetobacter sp. TaxID=472 RepID=UPI0035AE203A